MTIDERLDRLTHTVEFVATLQRTNEEHIGKLIEQNDLLSERMGVLNQRTIQAMDAINRLARIADIHEQRIEDLEDQRPSGPAAKRLLFVIAPGSSDPLI